MPFLGTIVDFAASLAAGCLGLIFKKRMSERINETVLKAMAIAVVYI